MPGVQAVGAVDNLPLNGGGTNTFHVQGQPEPDPARRPEAVMREVAGDYFRALAIRLLEGKFKPGDSVFVNTTPDGKLELSLEPEPMSVH